MEITNDLARIDLAQIHELLSTEAYWARGRAEQDTRVAWGNSLPFAALEGDELLGFARVVTDGAIFAYVGDVFVLREHRGRGVGKALVAAIIDHPQVRGLRRVALVTADAHALYEPFGFAALADPAQWLERRGQSSA